MLRPFLATFLRLCLKRIIHIYKYINAPYTQLKPSHFYGDFYVANLFGYIQLDWIANEYNKHTKMHDKWKNASLKLNCEFHSMWKRTVFRQGDKELSHKINVMCVANSKKRIPKQADSKPFTGECTRICIYTNSTGSCMDCECCAFLQPRYWQRSNSHILHIFSLSFKAFHFALEHFWLRAISFRCLWRGRMQIYIRIYTYMCEFSVAAIARGYVLHAWLIIHVVAFCYFRGILFGEHEIFKWIWRTIHHHMYS